MSVSRIKHHIAAFFRALKVWVLCGLGLVVLASLYYFLATVGPRRVGDAATKITTPDDPVVARLSDEVSALEKQYRETADAQMVTAESTEALAQAVEKQKQLLRTFVGAGQDQSARLVRLETELDSVRSREKALLVERLEKDGEELLTTGKIEEAGEKLREGLKLQREINTSSASSRYKNYVRETSLRQAVAAVDAAPLHKEMTDALEMARQATATQRWADALTAYTAARDAQVRINREYGRTRYADLAGVDRLSAEIESLNAAGIAQDIEAKQKAGDDAMARKLSAEAAEFFSQAETLQLDVNQNYPRSRFVSSQRIEDLEVKRQTALSAGLADSLEEMDRTISRHLSRREVVTAEQKLGEAGQLVDKLFAEYPKSRRLNGNLRIKLAYLSLRRADIRVMQDQVYDRLLPLPGVEDRLMMKTEVPQSLYLLVMNTNPSRNPGRNVPVDSVSWTDAQEFCARLSWLLGASVHLPTADEFRVALGSDGGGEMWSRTNSEGHSHEVGRQKPNTVGFSDLLGNLAEWSAAPADTDRARVVGGSYLDTPETLVKVPTELLVKNDRARHVGLRIVVEL